MNSGYVLVCLGLVCLLVGSRYRQCLQGAVALEAIRYKEF